LSFNKLVEPTTALIVFGIFQKFRVSLV